jgi:hypothetical protein
LQLQSEPNLRLTMSRINMQVEDILESTIKFLILSLSVSLLTSACTMIPLERNASSGYTNYTDSDYREVSLKDLSGRHDDFTSRSLTPNENENYNSQVNRKNLEAKLETPEEKKQYLRYRPYLTEAEKVEFLQLDDVYSRERWIQSRGVAFASEKHSRNIASLIEQNDIALGMQKDAVKDSWGDPDYVEVSGNPKFENERWRFALPVQTPEGYQIEERFVYFENGHVVGWSSH